MRDGDDEDDSMAANPEAPHSSAGYVDTLAERRRAKAGGQWVPVFRPGAERPATMPTVKHCRGCKGPTPILHSISPGIVREYCGACQGKSHR